MIWWVFLESSRRNVLKLRCGWENWSWTQYLKWTEPNEFYFGSLFPRDLIQYFRILHVLMVLSGFVFSKSCLYKYANQWQWKVQYKWDQFLFLKYKCLLSINSSESCVGLHQWCISQIWTQSPFQIHMTYQRKTPMLVFTPSHKAHPCKFFWRCKLNMILELQIFVGE